MRGLKAVLITSTFRTSFETRPWRSGSMFSGEGLQVVDQAVGCGLFA